MLVKRPPVTVYMFTLVIRWQMVAGSDRGVFMNGENSPTLTLGGLREGTYSFRLTVYDKEGLMDDDEVTIRVDAGRAD